MLSFETKEKFNFKYCFFILYIDCVIFLALAKEVSVMGGGGYTAVASLCFTLVLPNLEKVIKNIHLPFYECIPKRESVAFGTFVFLISFIVLATCWFANFPGAFSNDSIDQYKQAVTGQYNDWHPVLHTLLFFTIPLKLTGHSSVIILFQIIEFSLLLSCVGLTIWFYMGMKFSIFCLFFILFNPVTLTITMFPWKDVAFAMSACLCMVFVINIYFKGIRKIWKLFLFAFMLVCTTIFRHNGVLFTFPLILALLSFIPLRRWLALLGCCVLCFFLIKIPLYSCLKVEKPAARVMETVALPLSVICYVDSVEPELLDKETKEFVAKLTKFDDEEISRYQLSGFNSIKWDKNIDWSLVDEIGRVKILRLMCRCFFRAPKKSAIALIGVTRIVWSLEMPSLISPGIVWNSEGISWRGSNVIKSIYDDYILLSYTKYTKYMASLGVMLAIMIAFMLFRINIRREDGRKRLLLCIPVLIYDFGTMLFLGGPDYRFFYVTFLVCPLVLLLTLTEYPAGNT